MRDPEYANKVPWGNRFRGRRAPWMGGVRGRREPAGGRGGGERGERKDRVVAANGCLANRPMLPVDLQGPRTAEALAQLLPFALHRMDGSSTSARSARPSGPPRPRLCRPPSRKAMRDAERSGPRALAAVRAPFCWLRLRPSPRGGSPFRLRKALQAQQARVRRQRAPEPYQRQLQLTRSWLCFPVHCPRFRRSTATASTSPRPHRAA